MAAFSRLPGVGPKTALRFVYGLLRGPKADIQSFSRALLSLSERIQICDVCFTYSEDARCDICSDPTRGFEVICVVEEARDISTIETTGAYRGRYHVLGGVLNPIEGVTPDTLRIRELKERITSDTTIRELILAFSPTVHGEATMMYLARELQPLNRRITRLARGLPTGASIEYADEVTLGDALKGRREA